VGAVGLAEGGAARERVGPLLADPQAATVAAEEAVQVKIGGGGAFSAFKGMSAAIAGAVMSAANPRPASKSLRIMKSPNQRSSQQAHHTQVPR
jgi:hypothetical protein